LAGEPGLEPRLTESESVVLPLNYSPAGAARRPLRCRAGLITKSRRNANSCFEKISGHVDDAFQGLLKLFSKRIW
jgi:hypothetical protein